MRILCVFLGISLAVVTAKASTIIDFSTTADGTPLANNTSGGGEVNGTEWSSLGIFFRPMTNGTLNISCTTDSGPSGLCLSADRPGQTNVFNGTFFIDFMLNGTPQYVDRVYMEFVFGNSNITFRDAMGNQLANYYKVGNLDYSNPNIASIQVDLGVTELPPPQPPGRFADGMDVIQFYNLSAIGTAVPEPSTMMMALGGLLLVAAARVRASR